MAAWEVTIHTCDREHSSSRDALRITTSTGQQRSHKFTEDDETYTIVFYGAPAFIMLSHHSEDALCIDEVSVNGENYLDQEFIWFELVCQRGKDITCYTEYTVTFFTIDYLPNHQQGDTRGTKVYKLNV